MMGLVALPLIAQGAILHGGWRAGWVAVGVAVLVIGFVPNWLLMVRRPEDVGLSTDRRTVPHAPSAPAQRAERHFTRAQALRTRAFWMLSLFALFAYPAQAGVSLHQAPYLIERGISPAIAATIVSTFSLMSGVGSLGFGFFPRSVPIRYALTLSGVALSIGTFAMLESHAPRDGYVAAAVFGVGIGGLMTLLPIAWADYYGRASFGAVRGLALSGAGTGAGGWSFAVRYFARLVWQLRPVVAMLLRAVLSQRCCGPACAPAVRGKRVAGSVLLPVW